MLRTSLDERLEWVKDALEEYNVAKDLESLNTEIDLSEFDVEHDLQQLEELWKSKEQWQTNEQKDLLR